jgi:hypothetical protein
MSAEQTGMIGLLTSGSAKIQDVLEEKLNFKLDIKI